MDISSNLLSLSQYEKWSFSLTISSVKFLMENFIILCSVLNYKLNHHLSEEYFQKDTCKTHRTYWKWIMSSTSTSSRLGTKSYSTAGYTWTILPLFPRTATLYTSLPSISGVAALISNLWDLKMRKHFLQNTILTARCFFRWKAKKLSFINFSLIN